MNKFEELQSELKTLNKTMSLRAISEDVYDSKVTYGVIGRCIKGIEPRDNEIRKRLKLPLAEIQYRSSITGRYVRKS